MQWGATPLHLYPAFAISSKIVYLHFSAPIQHNHYQKVSVKKHRDSRNNFTVVLAYSELYASIISTFLLFHDKTIYGVS